jgi:glycosyltransferase involved in cell wall biosynthesis
MGKTYLYFAEWEGTRFNHAGMAHFCRRLRQFYDNTELVPFRILLFKGVRLLNIFKAIFYSLYLLSISKKGEHIFYFEYLTKNSLFQEYLAYFFRKLAPHVKQFGMIHLSGGHLKQLYKSTDFIKNKVMLLDRVYVLGSSLEAFLISIGVPQVRIVRILHYVDNDYYFPIQRKVEKNLRAICMGHIKRNFHLLREIISSCPEIDFIVCQGKNNLKPLLGHFENVRLYEFIPEEELKCLIQESDISLNVMDDTVGSNVITTSMACGLAMIVSDVGSIRDYCNENNAIFCKTSEDFRNALLYLNGHRDKCEDMKEQSLILSGNFWITKIAKDFMLNMA